MIVSRRAAKGLPSAKGAMVAAPLPLQNGDRLTAGEFLRRYDAMPEVKKAELINGIVYMASPVRARQHGIPDNWLQGWLFFYTAHTPGTRAAANSTVRFDADTVPQPDGLLMIERGGQARIGEDGYVHGAPELVAEVAASSAALDLHDKLEAYRRAGVMEYLVWRPVEQRIDWWVLEDDRFVAMVPDAEGVLRSRVFPGLTLDTGALLGDDAAAVLSKLGKGLNRAGHKAFVKRLAEGH